MLTKAGNKGARWTPESDAELVERCDRGELLPQMARAMGRTQEAVRTRANYLKIPVRSTERRSPSIAVAASLEER